jgi:hypothetical protein
MQTGMPPTWVSHTIEVSLPRQRAQRSSGSASTSETARITERMSNGFFRSGLASKTSPTVRKSLPGTLVCGDVRTSRSIGSAVGRRRGNRSPGTT